MKIFDEQVARFPDLYSWTRKFIEAMWHGHWTPEEFNFKADVHDFKTVLTKEEQGIINRTLTAIGQIEISVKKFWAKIGDTLPHPSIIDMGYVMAGIEVIHNIAYEKLLVVLGLEDSFKENLKADPIAGRVKYLRKYLDKQYKDNKKQFLYALILFTLFVENTSLFSQFYIVMWFGRFKNVLKDTNKQVKYTTKEELIHGLAGSTLVNVIRTEYPELFDDDLKAKIQAEALEAYEAECKIIDWILGDYEGPRLNKTILKEYVKYRINVSMESIGFDKPFEIDELLYRDFEWMNEEVLAPSQEDFFKGRPIDYSKKSRVVNRKSIF